MAVAFSLVAVRAAEPKQPSLIGVTREQVLARLGEPKSNIVAGSREVLFFPRQRVVLRENVVIEVEQLPAEAPRRPPPPPVEPIPAPAVAAGASPGAPGATAAPGPAGATATSEKVAAPPAETPPPPPAPVEVVNEADAPLVIKSVRPAGSSAPRVAPAAATSVSAPPPAKSEPAPPRESARAERAAPPEPVTQAPAAPVAAPAPARDVAVRSTEPAQAPEAVAVEPTAASAEAPKVGEPGAEVAAGQTPPPADAPKAKAKVVRSRLRGEVELPEQKVFTTQSYVIAFGVIASVGYLIWRRRQRQIELAATTVSRTPFILPTTTGTGARFTGELLSKLEWRRFEELVASYYSKTGVVAVRTKTGPASPVHVRISWKGEPRPFACVQCIAQPRELIDAKPLQELFQVLTAEDIRRGYVVSTGKFNVGARDFAEEKHITLLSGEIFLEKLNALPDTARNELMQEITTGDYTTPSCPKCEAKMIRSPDDPTAWHCPEHADVVIPARV